MPHRNFLKKGKNFRVVLSRLTGCPVCQFFVLVRIRTAFQQKIHDFDIPELCGTCLRRLAKAKKNPAEAGFIEDWWSSDDFCKRP